jgi:hypothetical protein
MHFLLELRRKFRSSIAVDRDFVFATIHDQPLTMNIKDFSFILSEILIPSVHTLCDNPVLHAQCCA